MDPKENPEKSIADSTINELHKDGVDISSRVSEENEFSVAGTEAGINTVVKENYAPGLSTETKSTETQPVETQPTENAFSALQKSVNETLNIKEAIKQPPNTPVTNTSSYSSIKQLRTFKTDAEEAVKYQNVSKVSIAVAEHKKKESAPIEYEKTPSNFSPVIIVGLLFVLIIAGAGGYYWFFMKTPADVSGPKISSQISLNTIIPYTKIEAKNIDTTNKPLEDISLALISANLTINDTFALIPMPLGTTTMITDINSVFSKSNMPDRLKRSLAKDYMIGAFNYSEIGPFIILKNTFFQNSFAGMLEWEKDMRNDLISIIKINHPDEKIITSNSDIFSDMVISNVDSRTLKNENGEIILVYAFADKDTIVITTNIETLKHILDRLLSVRVVQ